MSLSEDPVFPCTKQSKAGSEVESRVIWGGGWAAKVAEAGGWGTGVKFRDAGRAHDVRSALRALRLPH